MCAEILNERLFSENSTPHSVDYSLCIYDLHIQLHKCSILFEDVKHVYIQEIHNTMCLLKMTASLKGFFFRDTNFHEPVSGTEVEFLIVDCLVR